MRIIYDARLVGWPLSGLGRFVGDLLLALLNSRIRSDVRVTVLAPDAQTSAVNPYMRLLEPHLASGRCVVHHLSTRAISIGQQLAIPRYLRKVDGDLYFYPTFDVPARVAIPFIFVVHDLIPLKVPGYFQNMESLKKAYFRWCIDRGLHLSRRCVAVSATTRSDILDEFGAKWESKIDVSFEGSTLDVAGVDPLLRGTLGVAGPYLLYVGTRRPNKNIKFMIDVFAEMRALGYRGELVMAGSTQNFGFDVDRYAAGVQGVRIVGPVRDDQLASLYAATDALVFLSKYEGFGVPVIEAARFGRRTIVSDGGALGEVAPTSACRIPLTSRPAQAAAQAIDYLRDTKSSIDLSRYCETFSWSSVARTIFQEAY